MRNSKQVKILQGGLCSAANMGPGHEIQLNITKSFLILILIHALGQIYSPLSILNYLEIYLSFVTTQDLSQSWERLLKAQKSRSIRAEFTAEGTDINEQ